MHRWSDIAKMADLYSGSTHEERLAAVNYLEEHPDLALTIANLKIRKAAMQRTRLSKNLAATTKDMREIARDAHRLGLNRQMKPAQFKLLDPRGTHIISPKFYHDRADGKLVEWHCRCDVRLKLLGKQQAVELVMDISDSFLGDYLTLDEHRDLVQHGKEIRALEPEEGDPEPITETMTKELLKMNEIVEGNEATPNADKLIDEAIADASAEGKG